MVVSVVFASNVLAQSPTPLKESAESEDVVEGVDTRELGPVPVLQRHLSVSACASLGLVPWTEEGDLCDHNEDPRIMIYSDRICRTIDNQPMCVDDPYNRSCAEKINDDGEVVQCETCTY